MNPDNPIVNVPPKVGRRFKMVPIEEAETLATELAAMEQEDTACHYDDSEHLPAEWIAEAKAHCECCHGKVKVFDDSVRVPCPLALCKNGILQADYRGQKLGGVHKACDGRGWTALSRREDLVTWWQVLDTKGFHLIWDSLPEFGSPLQVRVAGGVSYKLDKMLGQQIADKAGRLLTLLAQKEHP